ncbi:hypothetical protein ACGF5F_29735 [Streptomyces sp. NPDC047821]|uniref:hypothetical protein n=1 Tax=Streptomyces sp. NPDC047821 TaxID=3365488 RepID=UPI003720E73A
MSDFRWEDPPPSSQRVYRKHDAIARQLRANPARWAMVALCRSSGNARSMASNIRVGKTLAYTPAGDFDAVVREVDDEVRVYARYLGEGKDG